MSCLKHHVSDVVVVVSLLVSDYGEVYGGVVVLWVGWNGDGESSMAYVLGLNIHSWNVYALGEEYRPRPSTPHHLVLGLDDWL